MDLVAVDYLQRGEGVPEEHLERRYLKSQPPQVAFQARCHGAYDLRVEADPGHAGKATLDSLLVGGDPVIHVGAFALQYAPAGLGRIERQPELPRQHVRSTQRQYAQRGPRRESVQYLVDRTVAPSGHDQTVPREGSELGGMIGVL